MKSVTTSNDGYAIGQALKSGYIYIPYIPMIQTRMIFDMEDLSSIVLAIIQGEK